MPKHTHTWKYSYSIKTAESTEYVYYCKPCGSFKRTKTKPQIDKRLSNMGGEFSTNWTAS